MDTNELNELIEKELIDQLGRIIQRIRKAKGMTQAFLGSESKTSQMTVQRLESGKGAATRLDAFISVIKSLDTTPTDVFFELDKGVVGSKRLQSKWEKLTDRIQTLNPSDREWVFEIIEKVVERL